MSHTNNYGDENWRPVSQPESFTSDRQSVHGYLPEQYQAVTSHFLDACQRVLEAGSPEEAARARRKIELALHLLSASIEGPHLDVLIDVFLLLPVEAANSHER